MWPWRRRPGAFTCTHCGRRHDELPACVFIAPDVWSGVPAGARPEDFELTDDMCVIGGEHFFVRCSLEIPIHGRQEPLSFGVWGTLSEANFLLYNKTFLGNRQGSLEPMFSWLGNSPPDYPDTSHLAGEIHPRDNRQRPLFKIAPGSDHPLALHQRNGVARDYAIRYLHDHCAL